MEREEEEGGGERRIYKEQREKERDEREEDEWRGKKTQKENVFYAKFDQQKFVKVDYDAVKTSVKNMFYKLQSHSC